MFVCVGTGLVCRLEERSAGPPAGRAWAKNKKSSGPRCQRSVPVFSSSTETFWSLSGVFSSLQKNDSLYLEGGRKKTLFEMVAHLYKLWPKYICRLALHLTDWHQTQSIYRSRIHSLLFWRFIHCWPASWSFLSVSYPVRRSACLL